MTIAPAITSTGVVQPRDFTKNELDLIRRTVAKDCNRDEFDLFIHICRHRGLDPLRRHIYAWVFNKDDPNARNMVPVISQEGQLSIARRMGDYRPDDRAPRIEYDPALKDPMTNPLGIVRAEVTLYQFTHGQWHPVVGEAYWDEYAPIIESAAEYEWVETGEVWPDSGRPKKKKIPKGDIVRKLDAKKTGWVKMPRVMLPKCARMQAARLGWPDDFGGLYAEEEIDRARSLEMSAFERAEMAATERRLEATKSAGTVLFDFMEDSSAPLARVPVGQIADRIDDFIKENADSPATLEAFRGRNREALREFWAKAPGDALEIKKRMETAIKAGLDKMRASAAEDADGESAHQDAEAAE